MKHLALITTLLCASLLAPLCWLAPVTRASKRSVRPVAGIGELRELEEWRSLSLRELNERAIREMAWRDPLAFGFVGWGVGAQEKRRVVRRVVRHHRAAVRAATNTTPTRSKYSGLKLSLSKITFTGSSGLPNPAVDGAKIEAELGPPPPAESFGGGSSGGAGTGGVLPLPANDPTSGYEIVSPSWTTCVNVTCSTPGTLVKSAGGSAYNAGARSTQTIAYGYGYVEYTPTAGGVGFGLSADDPDQGLAGLDFGIEVNSSSTYKPCRNGCLSQLTYTLGDVFRIQANNGIVTLRKNGTTVYTYSGVASYPLFLDTSIFLQSATASGFTMVVPPAFSTETVKYISTAGTQYATGTIDSPTDPATMLGGNRPVNPGDTIYWRGGTYTGSYVVKLIGTVGGRITITNYPGEHVIVDTINVGAQGISIEVPSNYVDFIGDGRDYSGTIKSFEILNSGTSRVATTPGSHPPISEVNGRSNGACLESFANNIRVINVIGHDCGNGFNKWPSPGKDNVFYGLISSNNGWNALDRGHGHNYYTQNDSTTQTSLFTVSHILTFNSFTTNFKFAGQAAHTDNLTMSDSISVTAGYPQLALGGAPDVPEVQFGSDDYGSKEINVARLYTYHAPNLAWGGLDTNYASIPSLDLSVTDSYVIGGGDAVLSVSKYQTATLTGNVVAAQNTANTTVVNRTSTYSGTPSTTGLSFSNNAYFSTIAPVGGKYYTFSFSGVTNQAGGGKLTFNADTSVNNFNNYVDTSGSTFTVGSPTTNKVAVMWQDGTIGQSGRGQAVVYNWEGLTSETISLVGSDLVENQAFVIRNGFNYFGTVVATGVYHAASPSISVSLTSAASTAMAQPTGLGVTLTKPSVIFSFVILPSTSIAGAPTAPTNLSISKCTAALGCTLAWISNSNSGDSADTGFIVSRAFNGGAYSDIFTTAAHAETATNLPGGYGLWSYRVRATNSSGDSLNVGPVSERNPTINCFGRVCPR